MTTTIYDILPERLYSGTLTIGRHKLSCAVLDNGMRVITPYSIFSAFGKGGGEGANDDSSSSIPSFLNDNHVMPYVKNVFPDGIDMPVKYISKKGRSIYSGYNAKILPLICEVYLQANAAGALTNSHKACLETSKLFTKAFSKKPIADLIDEATGYHTYKAYYELERLLSQHIHGDLLPWTSVFDDDFFKEIYRLKGWDHNDCQQDASIGKITNFLVYNRLPVPIIDKLKELSPLIKSLIGKDCKTNTIYRRLTREEEYIKLKEMIACNLALMRACDDWDSFEKAYRKSYRILDQEEI